jgi:hypothetical protein
MEIVDKASLLLWPGAMDAYLDDALFWIVLAIALAVAWRRRSSSWQVPCRRASRHSRREAHPRRARAMFG